MPDRISQSQLWQIQQDFYQTLGMEAWDNKAPFYVTNSQVMAESYADLVIAFLLDQTMDPDQPVYILELGSGTGRLGFNFARELQRKQAFFPQLARLRLITVLSDIVEENVAFWESHPSLGKLGQAVDFALYWPERDHEVRLRKSGQTLQSLKNPLVVLANYVFDSMPHDEFTVNQKRVQECLIEVSPKKVKLHSSPNRLDIRDVDVVRSYSEIVIEGYYPDGSCEQKVLEHYARRIREGTFMVPTGALECVGNLRKIGSLFLLSSDRAFVDARSMSVYPEHPLAIHDGCFSHMVNYHGLSLIFESYLATQRYLLDGVQTVCLSDHPVGVHLNYAFRERLDRANALNSANELYAIMRDKPPFFNALIGFIRLNLNDPSALSAVAKRLAEMSAHLTYCEHRELLATLELVWENDYHFKGSANVTFWIGHLFLLRGVYDRALWFFERTVERQGEDAMLLFLQGNCLQQLSQKARAKKLYLEALKIAPGMPEAEQALLTLS